MVDVSARWQMHDVHILEEDEFVQGLSNPSLFVHVKRDIRLLVHGDDIMVKRPTHEENWFDSVLFLKHEWKYTEKFHSDSSNASFVLELRDPVGSRIWQG